VRHWRSTVAALFLLAQVGWLAYAQFQPWRWFAWAPNDYVTRYSVDVRVDGRKLARHEICRRYGPQFCRNDWPNPGRTQFINENPPDHLISQLRQYEETLGRGDHAVVRLRYVSTGTGPGVWRWPKP
jgi:hypothetical protein